ncbi:hypothetical protein KPH14_007118 [Odynerus spinipes]|uniref:Uncharacterized protein n=1 Tax=Odynerus spinipes TaxID=1348599 RepID=A0AAD9RS04_9HYME|nr:hypothetical protein KPH14_007118 [Odynerus spinipes]
MARVGLLTNHQNHESLYKNVGAIRTSRFDENIPSKQSKEDNFQSTYFRPRFSKVSSKNRSLINDNQTSSGFSYDSTENKSDSVSNVLRWLESLPPSFVADNLEGKASYQKLDEKSPNMYKCNEKKNKSLVCSLQNRSAAGTPFEGKGKMPLERNRRVDFVDGSNSRRISCPPRKPPPKCCMKSFIPQLPQKCGKSDSRSMNTKSQHSLLNNDQRQRLGILKNASRRSILSTRERKTVQTKIASNRRLLHSIQEIINTVNGDDRSEPIEGINKNRKMRQGDGRIISVTSNVRITESSIKKPIFKNPEIEKSLDNAMRSTLKRYIHSNTWDNFKENNINGEPPLKKGKRALPSLAPVNSLHIDLGQNWNTHPVFSSLRFF